MVSLLSMVVNSWILGLLYWLCICCWVQLAKLFFGIFLSKREGLLEGEGRGGEAKRRRERIQLHLPAFVWVSVLCLFYRCLPVKLSQFLVALLHLLPSPRRRRESARERACPVKPLWKLVSDFEPLRLKRVLKNTKQQLCLRNKKIGRGWGTLPCLRWHSPDGAEWRKVCQ